MPDKPERPRATPLEPVSNEAWQQVQEAVRDLRYGQVVIVVHEGLIVQIDRTERRRFA